MELNCNSKEALVAAELTLSNSDSQIITEGIPVIPSDKVNTEETKNNNYIPNINIAERTPLYSNIKPFLFGFTKRQLTFLTVFGVSNIFRGVTVLIAGPFYPPEIKRFGPMRVLNLSIVNTGICTILFGCLTLTDDRTTFVALSLLIRIIAGAGDAGFYPSAFTIFSIECPDLISTCVGVFELFFGIGAIVGPVVCGALIDIIGFTYVYAGVGTIILICAVLTYFITPTPREMEISTESKESNLGLLALVKIPDVLMVIVSLTMVAASIGYITATLELHLSSFDLSSAMVGLVFSVGTAIYTVASPVWGYISDKAVMSKMAILIVGAIFVIIGFSFLGPLPFLPLEKAQWSIFVGYAIHGIGIGGSIMSAYPQALDAALKNGFPDTMATYGMVSSIFTSTFSFGNSVGPALGGVLYDNVGFRKGTLFVIAFSLLVIFLAMTLKVIERKRKNQEKQQIQP